MRRSFDVDVDSITYSVTYFSATRGLEVLVELSKIVGPALSNLFTEDGKITETQASKVLPGAVNALVSNLDKVETINLVKSIIGSASKGGQDISAGFDVEFAGRLGHLIKLITAILKVQYGDLKNVLSGLGTLRQSRKEK